MKETNRKKKTMQETITKYKQRKGQKMMMYIMVNYPMIYALVKGNPPGLSYEGWRSVYKELSK